MTKFPTKTCLLSIALLVSISCVFAQGWEKKYPNDFQSLSLLASTVEVAPSIDGGAVMASQDYIYNDTLLSYEKAIKLTKVDQDGHVQWQYKYPSINPNLENPVPDAIQTTADNGYIVSGHHDPQGNQYGDFFIMKFDQNGNLSWGQSFFANYELPKTNKVTQTLDGGYLISSLTKSQNSSNIRAYLVKVDNVGTIEWSQSYGNHIYNITDLVSNSDGTYTMIGSAFEPPSSILGGFMMKISNNGSFLWNYHYRESLMEECAFLGGAPTADNGFIATGYTFTGINTIVIKVDSTGNKEWGVKLSQFGSNSSGTYGTGIVQGDDGGYLISAIKRPTDGIAIKIDGQGTVLWDRHYNESALYSVVQPLSNGHMFGGIYQKSLHLVKLDDYGNAYTSQLTGNVTQDFNLNCAADSTEQPIGGWIVEAKGNDVYFGITDSLGNYTIDLDSGLYDLRLVNTGSIWQSCQGVQIVSLTDYDTLNVDFPVQTNIDCPYLTVDISAPFLRRCFDNVYVVSYCNQGTVPSQNTYVEVDLHPHLNFVSSSIPSSMQVGNTFTFLLGNLNVNECGTFKITANPDCDSTILGQALCAEAHIYPDTLCGNASPIWDGSITTLDVVCEGDSVKFTIQNTGSGDMINPMEYLVIEDNLILKQAPFLLLSMEKIDLKFPANGSTYRLYAGQAPGYFPPTYYPTIAIEGCGLNNSGTFSTGYVTMFSENDVLDQVSIDCHETIGSFDPNDKTAEPKGYMAEHYINPNTDLEYHVRFQNTGTDTAFTVVVRDTISEHLDISSLAPGTSSHPYRLEVINGHVLKFTFDDILLVDSTANEPASHGFVKFKISQENNLALGTLIYNSAAIYFDYNEPIITNETFHKIDEDFIEILISTDAPTDAFPEVAVKVQPNPFTEYAEFILEGAPQGDKTFEVYDAMGRLVRVEHFTDHSTHRFYKEDLSAGMYFYNIIHKGKLLASGKLIASH